MGGGVIITDAFTKFNSASVLLSVSFLLMTLVFRVDWGG